MLLVFNRYCFNIVIYFWNLYLLSGHFDSMYFVPIQYSTFYSLYTFRFVFHISLPVTVDRFVPRPLGVQATL